MTTDVENLIRQIAAQRGFSNPNLLVNIAKAESGLNPLAKNPSSSATGLFQILDMHGLSTAQRQDPTVATNWAIDNFNNGHPWDASRHVWDSNYMPGILQGTMGTGDINPDYSPNMIEPFSAVMRNISRMAYSKRAKSENKSALKEMGGSASNVSGSTFATIMGNLEASRGGDITKEYSATMNMYDTALQTYDDQLKLSQSADTSAIGNLTKLLTLKQGYINAGTAVPAWIDAALGSSDPTSATTSILNPQDAKTRLSLMAKADPATNKVPLDYYMQIKDMYMKTATDPNSSQIFDDKNGDLLSADDQKKGGITVSANAQQNIPMEYQTFLKDKTPQQQDAFMAIPEMDKNNVMQLIDGDLLIESVGSGTSGTAARSRLLADAKKIDPNFSENTNRQRYNFKNSWIDPNTAAYKTRTSINAALGHLSRLYELTQQLSSNTDFQKANSLEQWIAQNINTPGIADVVAQFQDTANLLGEEIAKAYAGGVPDVNSIAEQQKSIMSTSPQNIIGSVINNKSRLMSSLLTSTAEEYKNAMGEYPSDPVVQWQKLAEMKQAGVDTSTIEQTLQEEGYDVQANLQKYGASGGQVNPPQISDGQKTLYLHSDGLYYSTPQ